MDIISRGQWGARDPRNRSTVSWAQRREVVVHYSEGPTNQSVRSIQNFHMDGRNWADIGYNFLVDTEGRIYEGRGWLVVGAHAPDHNTSGIGVCMIGRNGDSTPAAKRAIRWLYDEAARRAGRSLKKLGHRDVFPTSCPGDELYAWVRAGMPADIEEDDMQLDDSVPVGSTYDGDFRHDHYPVSFVMIGSFAEAKRARIASESNGAAIGELAKALGELAADRGQTIDVDALVNRIETAIERVSVRLDVGEG